jgi:hypothetical protein
MRQVLAITVSIVLISVPTLGCKVVASSAQHQPSDPTQNQPTGSFQHLDAAERPLPGSSERPGSVEFELKSLPSDVSGLERWQATYKANGKTASFRFELSRSESIDQQAGLVIRSGKGRFLADPGSDSTVLIANLKTALDAKHLPTKVKRAQSLPFTYVSFEEHESLSNDGGFSLKPPGNWTPMKIFLGSDKDDIEVFFNLDGVDGKGQFSIKDSDYGDDAVRLLASVL